MKSLFFSLFITLNAVLVNSQTVPSSCIAHDSVYKKYKKSADKLAILWCEKTGNTFKDSILLNKQVSQQYLNSLVAVYNATTLPARDTVVRMIGITKDFYYPPDVNTLVFGADSSLFWVHNLRNNIIPCGNSQVDYLISKYYLKKIGYSNTFSTSLYHLISFRTDTNFYINRLCDKFLALAAQGINLSQPINENKSFSFNITDSLNSNFIELTYSYSWGDCMAGCLYNRSWKFRINNDCTVQYLGSAGNSLPQSIFTSIDKNNIPLKETEVFPNPFKNIVNINVQNTETNTSFTLYNSFGSVVLVSNKLCKVNKFDLSHLPVGLYYLIISDSTGSRITKLLKE